MPELMQSGRNRTPHRRPRARKYAVVAAALLTSRCEAVRRLSTVPSARLLEIRRCWQSLLIALQRRSRLVDSKGWTRGILMIERALLLAALTMLACSPAQTETPGSGNIQTALSKLDPYICDIMHETGIPGLAVAVVYQGPRCFYEGIWRSQAR